MRREANEFPGAASSHNWDEEYSVARNSRKDSELAAADHVLVPSRFARASLLEAGVPSSQITVIPFGCQPLLRDARSAGFTSRNKVILCVGNLSLRKGTPRLLRAWKRLGAYRTHSLRLIGSLQLAPEFFADYAGVVEHVPRLPQSDLGKHYATSYAFVMPAAAEGFAVVITEALAHGLPVVASENSGAAGFITHEKEGLLYPFEDEEELCGSLDRLLSRPEETAAMSRAAHALAVRWTWQQYRDAFLRLILKLLSAQMAIG
jgi:glycosyltransferase involved in cell wall biosynthesis